MFSVAPFRLFVTSKCRLCIVCCILHCLPVATTPAGKLSHSVKVFHLLLRQLPILSVHKCDTTPTTPLSSWKSIFPTTFHDQSVGDRHTRNTPFQVSENASLLSAKVTKLKTIRRGQTRFGRHIGKFLEMIQFRLLIVGLLLWHAEAKREIPVGKSVDDCLSQIGHRNRS